MGDRGRSKGDKTITQESLLVHYPAPVDIQTAGKHSRAVLQLYTVPSTVQLSYGHTRAYVSDYMRIIVELIVNTYPNHLGSLTLVCT